MSYSDYKEHNRLSWNTRTDHHVKSDFYDVDGFLNGKSSLNDIELNLLGDLKDKTILHLQCHFGLDSLSLAKLGAHVTGVDLSDNAIAKAKSLAENLNVEADFICSDIYELPQHLEKKFDVVFASYGTINWLPDLDKWANIISLFLKPGGKFVLVEFHPVVWMFDNNFEKIYHSYFNTGHIIESETGTYAEKEASFSTKIVTWNHGISEILNNLIKNGLEIVSFDEYDYSPYNCFNKTIEVEPRKFRIKHFENKLPMLFSIVAIKKQNK